jgi:hypothetical protein
MFFQLLNEGSMLLILSVFSLTAAVLTIIGGRNVRAVVSKQVDHSRGFGHVEAHIIPVLKVLCMSRMSLSMIDQSSEDV